MSEAPDRPHTDADAWATACAEDLAAEKARRREQSGYRPGSAADELRKLAEAVTDKVAQLSSPAAGMAAQALISQVKAVVDPIMDRNPDVFEHITAAGAELLAAYRSAVTGQEQRWTSGTRTPSGPAAGTGPGGAAKDGGSARPGGDGEDPGQPGTEHIDLD
jgi:Family of unknown function (DUF5304)